MKYLPLALSLLNGFAPVYATDTWDKIADPLPGPSQVIGFYSAGCVLGANALPLYGEGFQVMRPSRNRFYGHSTLIAFIQRLGQQAAARGKRLLIGDLAQPRGGPMGYGHRSHQSGLDVDIWFYHIAEKHLLSSDEAETLPMVSMFETRHNHLDPPVWLSDHQTILKLAAHAPEVERIFVHPLIKQTLCRSAGQDRSWLRKIRPWWGHDSHFHVRLSCPNGNSHCQGQQPPPTGDGCDQALMQWITAVQQAARAPSPKQKPANNKPSGQPAICNAVLAGSSAAALKPLLVHRKTDF
jgi:penicillin-insensitive murein endopeptidase